MVVQCCSMVRFTFSVLISRQALIHRNPVKVTTDQLADEEGGTNLRTDDIIAVTEVGEGEMWRGELVSRARPWPEENFHWRYTCLL